MRLIEAEMLMQAAQQQLRQVERGGSSSNPKGPLHQDYEELLDSDSLKDLTADQLGSLRALASPRLLTVWFNSW